MIYNGQSIVKWMIFRATPILIGNLTLQQATDPDNDRCGNAGAFHGTSGAAQLSLQRSWVHPGGSFRVDFLPKIVVKNDGGMGISHAFNRFNQTGRRWF